MRRGVASREGCAAPQTALVPHAPRGPSRPESTPPIPARETPQDQSRVTLLFQVKGESEYSGCHGAAVGGRTFTVEL